MASSTLFVIGLGIRFVAVFLCVNSLRETYSHRKLLLTVGTSFFMALPIFLFFFSDSAIPREISFVPISVVILIMVYYAVELIEEAHAQSETIAQTSISFDRYQAALLKLSKHNPTNLAVALSEIVTVDSDELGIARVGVWMYNEDRSAIYTLSRIEYGKVYAEPIELLAEDYPGYFNSLEENALINAEDARSHPATVEFTKDYLKPNDIHSMLDVPIRLDGEVVGIICHEHVRSNRRWTVEEQDFAHSIADLCALALAADKRRKVEAELRASERHLTDAQDVGQFGSFRWDLNSEEVIWSGETMGRLGFSTPNGPNIAHFIGRMMPEDGKRYEQTLRTALKEKTDYRSRFRQKPEFGDGYFEIRAAFRSGDGSERFEGTIQNITDQVLAEKENQRLEEQLIQSQKIESIGTLAGGIAHDFNNILTPILGYTDVALADSELKPDTRETMQEILHSALRAKDLVEQILIFGRRWEENREPLDLAETINRALKLVRPTLPSTIKIEVDIKPGYKLVQADATQMIQVLVNLCTNAWHAMEPKGGKLTLSLAAGDEGLTTVLGVTDTGTGIEPEARARIFDPFYTTKAVGQGTGLGLSVVHGIISKLGGRIEIDSEIEQYTTINVILPIKTEHKAETDKIIGIPQKVSAASILVVDDDKAVAQMLESMLSDLGYETDVHLNSVEALLCIQTQQKAYDLVLTDLTMPNLSGIELTRKIRAQDPDLPILIASGHSEHQLKEEVGEIPNCGYISKPITKADLAARITKELG